MPGDDGQSVRRGTRTISQSQQLPKLPSQSTDQNLSDEANRDAAPGGKRDPKKTFGGIQADRSHRDNLSEPRSGGLNAAVDARNSGQHDTRSSSSGNGRVSQRGSRDQATSRGSTSATSVTDATSKSVLEVVYSS